MKRNVTIAIDEDLYRSARIFAAANGTSVSALVEYCVSSLPGLPIAQRAVQELRRRRQTVPAGIAALRRGLNQSAGKQHCDPL